jgi:hypothetical protein
MNKVEIMNNILCTGFKGSQQATTKGGGLWGGP